MLENLKFDFLADLKTLKLTHEGRQDEQLVDDETFMFSKATALLAFAKFPNLAVSLCLTSYGPPPGEFLCFNLKHFCNVQRTDLVEQY